MKDSAFVFADAKLKTIPTALQQTLDKDGVAQSALFHLVFNGNLHQMTEENLPPSFQKAVLLRIKAALTEGHLKVYYHFGDALDVLNTINLERDERRFFSLSDILSFVDMDYQKKLIDLIRAAKSGKSSIVFRTFIRNRLTQEVFAVFKKKYSTFKDLSAEESSHFYQVFQINF
jgi:S-adenosylmethionine:diacylglycerol 3-amino-3-carboxypropyl transferase